MARKTNSKPYTHYHKDGSIWAKGQKSGEVMTGYWEWFRKDGSKMRSGYFDNAGQQTGEWITYDKSGKPHKTTNFKPK
jgi:antitoxin component YwqK of YwqJK toxin-antitoxin module